MTAADTTVEIAAKRTVALTPDLAGDGYDMVVHNIGDPTDAAITSGNGSITAVLKGILANTAPASEIHVESLWTDDTSGYFVRIDNGTSITWSTISGGASSAPGTGARPASGLTSVIDRASYIATATVGGSYTTGDLIDHFVTSDPATGVVLGYFWLNTTASTKLSSAPSSANISPVASLAAGAATSANQSTEITALNQLHTDMIAATPAGANVIGGVTVADGSLTTLGAKADAAAGTGTVSAMALLKQLHLDMLAATPAGTNNIGVVTVGGTSKVTVSPVITAGAYTTGNLVGPLMTFANALGVLQSGVLQSIRVASKTVQSAALTLHVFDTNPTNTTWTDKTAPGINVADIPYLVGSYPLGGASSPLGTHTIWNLDGIGKGINAASTSLYGILTVTGTPTFGSTSDISVSINCLKD